MAALYADLRDFRLIFALVRFDLIPFSFSLFRQFRSGRRLAVSWFSFRAAGLVWRFNEWTLVADGLISLVAVR